MNQIKEKDRLERRTKAAKALLRKMDGIFADLHKIPSYTGKSPFMDKVIRARNAAMVLHDELNRDLAELKSY